MTRACVLSVFCHKHRHIRSHLAQMVESTNMFVEMQVRFLQWDWFLNGCCNFCGFAFKSVCFMCFVLFLFYFLLWVCFVSLLDFCVFDVCFSFFFVFSIIALWCVLCVPFVCFFCALILEYTKKKCKSKKKSTLIHFKKKK